MHAAGITTVLEMGPGKVLAGLNKRIEQSMAAIAVQTPADLDQVLAAAARQHGKKRRANVMTQENCTGYGCQSGHRSGDRVGSGRSGRTVVGTATSEQGAAAIQAALTEQGVKGTGLVSGRYGCRID